MHLAVGMAAMFWIHFLDVLPIDIRHHISNGTNSTAERSSENTNLKIIPDKRFLKSVDQRNL